MKPTKQDALIPKFRVSLSLEQMKTIHALLCYDHSKIIDRAELIAWIGKNIRKAEFGVLEASHTAKESSSGIVSAKTRAIVQEVKETTKQTWFEHYMNPQGGELTEDQIISALEYKMENPMDCGSLTEEEKEVLNEAMTRKLLGGL